MTDEQNWWLSGILPLCFTQHYTIIQPPSEKKRLSKFQRLFFKINAIDQQQSFLKLAERYEPVKALLLRLNMIGKENWFLLGLYPLAFYCNSQFVTFHYTISEDIFSSFISFCGFCFWYPESMPIIFPIFIISIILYIWILSQLNLANCFFLEEPESAMSRLFC